MSTKRIVIGVVVLLMTGLSPAQQMNQKAQKTDVPAKIELSPLHPVNQLGQNIPVNIQLLDEHGNPVAANRNIDAEVKVEQPSGQMLTYAVTFTPGESTKQLPLSIDESGVAKLTVQQRDQQLIGGSSFVLVRPQSRKNAKPAKKEGNQKSASQGKSPNSRLQDFPRLRGAHAMLILAALPLQTPAADHSQPAAAPQLQLTISGEDANGGTRADGTTCAQVQVFYLGSDDLQRKVQIWLSPSNGKLDNNPIVIQKGAASGGACWTSQFPIAAATLTVAATDPPNFTFASIDGADPKKATHKFTDNIAHIVFQNVPSSITIVDSFSLTARFTDPNNQTVSLTEPRDVIFSADSALLKINPKQTTVGIGGLDASTVLIPTYFGKSNVQVSTKGYQVVTSPITITWRGVLIASLLGGLIGGVLAWVNLKGRLWVRIVTGLIVGLVASWAYVVVGLPKLEAAFLHNQLSVFFVALVVGFSGMKGFTAISSKFFPASAG